MKNLTEVLLVIILLGVAWQFFSDLKLNSFKKDVIEHLKELDKEMEALQIISNNISMIIKDAEEIGGDQYVTMLEKYGAYGRSHQESRELIDALRNELENRMNENKEMKNVFKIVAQ